MLIIGYGLLLLPIINLIYFLNKKRGARIFGSVMVGLFLVVFVMGSYFAWNPVVRSYEISIAKEAKQGEIHALLVTDLHLGKMVGNNHLERLIKITDELKPDIVLIAGDIIDDYIEPYQEENMGEWMSKLSAPLGVYATSGNHDYYGDDLNALQIEMEQAGITMLSDETIEVEGFYLVGRNDQTDKNRVAMEELVEPLNQDLPIIMLDHQPDQLDKAAALGVDVILSGHTHGGQVVPANLITSLIYENDGGYLKKGDLHSIVSTGFGLWGPPFRLGKQAEVIELKIEFKGSEHP